MSEPWGQQGAPAEGQAPAADGVTAGMLLRRAREAAGLHVAALAVSLKVPVRKLEALEDDRWDVLPDAVFVRALASSVCRSLKIDPQPILERLPQTSAPRLIHDGSGINTPFRAPSDGAPPTWIDHLTKPVFLAVFALLLGALVLILLPTQQQGGANGGKQAVDTVVSAPPAPAAAPTPAPEPAAMPTPEPAAVPSPANTPAVLPPPVSVVNAVTVASKPAAAASATRPAASAASLAKAAATPASAASAAGAKASVPAGTATAVIAPLPTGGVVTFRTKGASWIEVTDAKGVVVMRKQMEAGEAGGATGALPLQVTIGRVDHTEVQVRGKAFDLRPVSKDNVARFTVK